MLSLLKEHNSIKELNKTHTIVESHPGNEAKDTPFMEQNKIIIK